jgi:hypothetical protein
MSTLTVDDDLYQQASEAAVAQGKTVHEFVGEAETHPTEEAHPAQHQGTTQTEDRTRHHRRLTCYEWLSALIQGGILIATSVYMVFAGLQWSIMKDTLLLSNRPWVMVSDIITQNKIQTPGQEFKVTVTWKNVGNSPALHFDSFSTLILVSTPEAAFSVKEAEIPSCPERLAEFKSSGSLGPSITVSSSPSLTIDSADFTAIRRWKKRIIACGKAIYRDLFRGSHKTTFCYLYYFTEENEKFVPCPIGDIVN